ncbi:amino acid ABC transporter substrate-binding protein/permease [Micrococcus sp.]|uniref:amino acid ABC transporter substrate-binding protein/permease n=1 Tax=Micrococcus sp. TaxID=1271 RepID=UPI002A90EE68|nr:amino acid ABC transporter substrate-binding protein/permease [Micrococcus sp.]MDY6055856.1 amino acid ABC transporter substrate-binding protein/permease [Micrococcus sp.]
MTAPPLSAPVRVSTAPAPALPRRAEELRAPAMRAVVAVLAAVLAMLGAFAGAPAASAADGVEGKTFVIATDTTYAPFEYRGANGELQGIDIDLLNAIAEKKGFTVDWRSVGFNAALQALSSDQADAVIAGMSITDERRQTYDFSEPYFTGSITLAVRDGDDSIRDWADLQGKHVVVKTGSISEQIANERKDQYGFTVSALDQTTTLVESVRSGSADALVDDYPVISYGVTQGSGLQTVGERVDTGDYGFAVKKGQNPELLAAFNDGLAELRASGEYQQILDTYMAPEGATAVDRSTFWGLVVTALPALMTGLGNTLLVTLLAFVLAVALGLLFGFLRIASNPVLRWIGTAFVAVFRGTPILVWAFFFYFGLPQLIGMPVNIWVAGVLTLALNGGAYIAEIVRGGIQAVDHGQTEAARSLGLPYSTTMRRVVLPQAFTIMTPSMINQLVIMLKDSSLLLAIGFAELLYQAQQIYAQNYRVTEVLLIVAVIYFVVITALTWLANVVDRKVNA